MNSERPGFKREMIHLGQTLRGLTVQFEIEPPLKGQGHAPRYAIRIIDRTGKDDEYLFSNFGPLSDIETIAQLSSAFNRILFAKLTDLRDKAGF